MEGPNKKGEWLVAGSTIKMWVKESELKWVSPAGIDEPLLIPSHHQQQEREIIEIDLHGMRVHDAEQKLVQTLDLALLENARELWVNHGLGTGTLRELVVQFGRAHRHVAHVRSHATNPGITILSIA